MALWMCAATSFVKNLNWEPNHTLFFCRLHGGIPAMMVELKCGHRECIPKKLKGFLVFYTNTLLTQGIPSMSHADTHAHT